jgi:Xaa-Pro aminopeptidase
MELRQIRALKSDDEIAEHQVAIDTTVEAFKSLKKTLKEKHFEYEVEAHFNAEFRVHGTGGHAYEPIVAGGADACTLHYVDNNARLPENGLVLIDVGTQVSGYAADITRTYAIGTPTERQRRIHKAVETAHHKIIALIKPDLTFHEYQESSDAIMKIALIEVGLLESVDDQETYRHYFPHSVSHGLGIDVHESLGGYDTFRPGMLLTVEPGIYIPEEGIGVRIEDNILVTSTGNRNLSAHLPTSL